MNDMKYVYYRASVRVSYQKYILEQQRACLTANPYGLTLQNKFDISGEEIW